jgi:hypothetical protein
VKHLVPTIIAFMAVSLVAFFLKGGAGPVALFACGATLIGFQAFIDRYRMNDREALEKLLNEKVARVDEQLRLHDGQISTIATRLGWGD